MKIDIKAMQRRKTEEDAAAHKKQFDTVCDVAVVRKQQRYTPLKEAKRCGKSHLFFSFSLGAFTGALALSLFISLFQETALVIAEKDLSISDESEHQSADENLTSQTILSETAVKTSTVQPPIASKILPEQKTVKQVADKHKNLPPEMLAEMYGDKTAVAQIKKNCEIRKKQSKKVQVEKNSKHLRKKSKEKVKKKAVKKSTKRKKKRVKSKYTKKQLKSMPPGLRAEIMGH